MRRGAWGSGFGGGCRLRSGSGCGRSDGRGEEDGVGGGIELGFRDGAGKEGVEVFGRSDDDALIGDVVGLAVAGGAGLGDLMLQVEEEGVDDTDQRDGQIGFFVSNVEEPKPRREDKQSHEGPDFEMPARLGFSRPEDGFSGEAFPGEVGELHGLRG